MSLPQAATAPEDAVEGSALIAGEGTALAAFVAAKLCHDFISPAAAISSGLDLLKDPSAQDMRDDAMNLIEASSAKLIEIVNFARVAFGAATMAETFEAGELEKLTRAAFSHGRAELEWDVEPATFTKPAARALLNLAQIAGAALSMGGTAKVSVRSEDADLVMRTQSTGPRIRVKAETLTGLKGEPLTEGLAGQWIQGFWLHEVVREAGGTLTPDVGEEAFTLEIRIPA